MAENLDLQSLTALRAGIMVGGELAWHRRESRAGGSQKPAEAGGDVLDVLPLAEELPSSGAHHHPTRVPASDRLNLLNLL